MGDTAIAWCDKTWNPLAGCTRVSPGCDHCYAFALHDRRYAQNLAAARATGTQQTKPADLRAIATSPHVGGSPVVGKPDHPLPWPRQYDRPFSEVHLFPDRLAQPLHWREPKRVFVNSMSDLFHEDVPDNFIAAVFGIMAAAPRHTFQVLTKRPDRMRAWFEWINGGDLQPAATRPSRACAHGAALAMREAFRREPALVELARRGVAWPLRNVWLGISAEDQERLDQRSGLLRETPAAVRFTSAEPLLGPLDLRGALRRCTCGRVEEHRGGCGIMGKRGIDWVIVGGESGPHARPMDHAWVRSIRDQCRAASVPYFGKQDSGATQGRPLPGDLGDREFPR